MRHLELYMGEQQIFDLFFASVASVGHCHPAAGRSNGIAVAPKLSLDECADVALEMLEIRRDVMFNSHLASVEREEIEKQAEYLTRKAREEDKYGEGYV